MHTPPSPAHFGIEPGPELLALQEARARAVEARLAAERALRDAEAIEAQLLRQEEQAVAAAVAEHRRQLRERADRTIADERAAMERVAALERELETARAAVAACRRERELAHEALRAVGEPQPAQSRVATVNGETTVAPSPAQRAAERRAADATRHARR